MGNYWFTCVIFNDESRASSVWPEQRLLDSLKDVLEGHSRLRSLGDSSLRTRHSPRLPIGYASTMRYPRGKLSAKRVTPSSNGEKWRKGKEQEKRERERMRRTTPNALVHVVTFDLKGNRIYQTAGRRELYPSSISMKSSRRPSCRPFLFIVEPRAPSIAADRHVCRIRDSLATCCVSSFVLRIMKKSHKAFNRRENYSKKITKEEKKKLSLVYSPACLEKRNDLFFSFVSLFWNFHGIVLYGISSKVSHTVQLPWRTPWRLNNKKKFRDSGFLRLIVEKNV